MKITEKRVVDCVRVRPFFLEMGWFDRDPKTGNTVAMWLKSKSLQASGITNEDLYTAALYVEHYTDPDILEGLDTADIMGLINGECRHIFEIQGGGTTNGPATARAKN